MNYHSNELITFSQGDIEYQFPIIQLGNDCKVFVTVEKKPPEETQETQDEDTVLRERIALRSELNPSYSPKTTRRMQMRISYAERDGEGKYSLH